MANDNTGLLVLLAIAGYVLISKSSTTSPYTYPSSGSGSSSKGASGGGSGGGGTGGGGSPSGTPGSSTSPASGSNPQTAQQGSGAPFGPQNPTTDPCNQASPDYDSILCTNEGGTQYWASGGVVEMPTSPVNPPASCQDDGDPCNPSGCSYSPDVCAEMSGTYTGVDTTGGDFGGGFDDFVDTSGD